VSSDTKGVLSIGITNCKINFSKFFFAVQGKKKNLLKKVSTYNEATGSVKLFSN